MVPTTLESIKRFFIHPGMKPFGEYAGDEKSFNKNMIIKRIDISLAPDKVQTYQAGNNCIAIKIKSGAVQIIKQETLTEVTEMVLFAHLPFIAYFEKEEEK